MAIFLFVKRGGTVVPTTKEEIILAGLQNGKGFMVLTTPTNQNANWHVTPEVFENLRVTKNRTFEQQLKAFLGPGYTIVPV